MSTNPKNAPTFEQVYGGLLRVLNGSRDLSTSRTIASWFLEQPNYFDPNGRRRPKPVVLILLTYLFLMGATFAAFNL
jgi:hypothetical protein